MLMKYRAYTLNNFRQIPQISKLTEEQRFIIEVVGNVLPFKTNNYVVDELIDWNNFENDPFFILTFPQKEMLSGEHFNKVASLIKSKVEKPVLKKAIEKIRLQLNPNPAGQEHNVPEMDGVRLDGIQHKYKQTMLFSFSGTNMSCILYILFSLATVCIKRLQVCDERGRQDDQISGITP